MVHTSFVLLLPLLLTFPGEKTGEEALLKVVERFSAIRDYTVTLDVVADIERLNVPPMHVKLYYKQPDKFHFDSEGFALLPREGMALNPAKFLSRYTVIASASDSVNGRRCTQVTLQPRREKDRLLTVILSIDPGRFTIEQITAPLMDGRTMTAVIRHQLQSGHWMPSETIVTFVATEEDTTGPAFDEQSPPVQPARLPRTGKISIRYSDFRINTGLPDDLFEKHEDQTKE